MSRWLGETFGAFHSRGFVILWTGTLSAFVAFFMSSAVTGVVAFDLTGKNRAVGAVVAAQGVSQGFLGPIGGAMADRLSKKMVILACQVLITACFLSLCVLVAGDLITILYLSAGSFGIGAAFSFLGPARNSWMVDLVGPSRRGNAIALSQVALNASRIVGPLLAALVLGIGALGAGGAYAVMAILYAGAIAATVTVPDTPANTSEPGRSVMGDILVGIRYVAGHGRLRLLIPSYVVVVMLGFGYITVLPGLVKNELGHTAKDITLILAISAVGGLAASLGVASRADAPQSHRMYTAACVLFGLALIGCGLAPSYLLLGVAMFFVGAGSGGLQTLSGAIVSQLSAPQYLGRVLSLTFLAFAISNVVSLPVGFLADAIGERPSLMMTGAGVVAVTVAFVMVERWSGISPPGRPGAPPAGTDGPGRS